MRGKVLRFLIAFGLVIGSVMLTLALAEVVLHLTGFGFSYMNPMHSFHINDPVLGYRGLPNADAHFVRRGVFDVAIRHDARGFRLQEFAKAPGACSRSVYVYGDSFTWGWGVDQGQGFTDLLNRDVPGVCFYNRGIDASGTIYQFTLFNTEDLAGMKPGDTVLVMFCFNDFEDNHDQNKEVSAILENGSVKVLPPRKQFQKPWRAFIRRNCRIYNIGSQAAAQIRRKFKEAEPERKRPAPAVTDPEFILTKHFLGEFKRVCDERGLRFAVAMIPLTVEFGEPEYGVSAGDAAQYRQLLMDIVTTHQVEFIDLLPSFVEEKQKNSSAPLTIIGDAHWNPAGHALVARTLATRLAANSAN